MSPTYLVTVGFPLWVGIRPGVGLTSWLELTTSPLFVAGLILYWLEIFLVLWRQGRWWDFPQYHPGKVGGSILDRYRRMSPDLTIILSLAKLRLPSLSWIVSSIFYFIWISVMGAPTFKLIWLWGEANDSVLRGELAMDSKYSPVNGIKGAVGCSLGFEFW